MASMVDDYDIKEAVLKTIAWFDVFDYPLTKEELWRFGLFDDRNQIAAVEHALAGLLESGRAERTEIFVHMPGRGGLVAERKRRYNYTDQKFKRALKLARLFRLAPSIEMVAIVNLIGSHNLREAGDIDLLVVAKPGTIWTTRLITTLAVKLLGMRPTKSRTKNTICLSFYATSDGLNFKHVAETDFLYFYYWLAFLTPIYDRGGVYEKLMAANHWLLERLPNYSPMIPHQLRSVKPCKRQASAWLFDLLLPLEDKFREFQLEILPDELRQIMNHDSRVVVNDTMLKFHAGNDRRRDFQERYLERLKQGDAA